MSGQTAKDAGQQSESVRGRIGLGAAAGGFDADIYGAGGAGGAEAAYSRELTDEADEDMGSGAKAESSYAIARAEAAHTAGGAGSDVNPFDAHRSDGRVSDRDNEYTARRLARGFSPVRKDAFAEEIESGKAGGAAAAQPKGKKGKAAAAAAAAAAASSSADDNVRSYKDIMMEQQLAREEAAVLKNIEKKRVEEEARRAAGIPAAAAAAQPDAAAAAAAAPADGSARKRRRWGETDDGSAAKTAADMPSASSESLLDSSENWAAAPQPSADEEQEEDEEDQFAQPGAPQKELNSWDATPVALPAAGTGKNKRSRWDQADATPLSASLSSSAADATPLHIPMAGGDVTPLYSGGETPVGAPPGTATKKRSRWGETPAHSSLAASAADSAGLGGTGPAGMSTPMHMSSAEWKQRLEAMTPDQLQALRAEAEIAARNQPLSDEELDAMLPGEKDGYQILVPPESYKPIRTPARKLLMTPLSAFGGQEGFFIPIDAPGIKYDVPPTPAESGLPAFQKEEDSKYFGALLEEVDETRLTSGELKERRIMKLLLKIKNGTPPQRKTALRTISDKAREFGAAPLFDQVLPLLMSPTLEDGERHVLVKVIDRILYKLDDLVRPYVHKILIVIEPMLIEDDYYCFPQADHELLTDEGFRSYAQVVATIVARSFVNVACPVQEAAGAYRMEFHPVRMSDLIDTTVTADGQGKRLLHFQCPRKGKGRHNSLDFQVTSNHTLLVKMGAASAPAQPKWKTTTAESVMKSSSEAAWFIAACTRGAVDSAPGTPLPFVSALGLTTVDQIEAFLELYGYWLGDGWLVPAEKAICFGPYKAQDVVYLDVLLARLPLAQIPAGEQRGYRTGEFGVKKRVPNNVEEDDEDGEAASTTKRNTRYKILHPAWWALFGEQYGHKYKGSEAVACAGAERRGSSVPAGRYTAASSVPLSVGHAVASSSKVARTPSTSHASSAASSRRSSVSQELSLDEFQALSTASSVASSRPSSASSSSSAAAAASVRVVGQEEGKLVCICPGPYPRTEADRPVCPTCGGDQFVDATPEPESSSSSSAVSVSHDEGKMEDEQLRRPTAKDYGPEAVALPGGGIFFPWAGPRGMAALPAGSSAAAAAAAAASSATKPEISPEPPAAEDINSAKWFWHWVLNRLNRRQSRLVLRGLRFADGNQKAEQLAREAFLQRIEKAKGDAKAKLKAELKALDDEIHPVGHASIHTASARFRDEILRLVLRAGFAGLFGLQYAAGTKDSYGRTKRSDQWEVYYSQEQGQPKLFIRRGKGEEMTSDINEVKNDEPIPVWCVSVPTKERLIMVRRVLKRGESGNVTEASRVVVVGNCRVEGREIISNLAKAAGLATMIATMRPDIDNQDEYVRNTTARAFAVVASALGVHSLLPFLKAVCQSKKSWEARHTGIKIVQQIAILSGCAILSHLKSLVEIIEHGLNDEQSKVRCIAALALAALAEAAHPYGIESFDSVLRPLWRGIRSHRGKTLAAFLKAIGYIIPLMDETYASYYTKEVMVILIREFATPDEEMKKIVLKVVKQCVQTTGVEAEYIKSEILPPFFQHFWVRRMALDKRNYAELVSTTEALAQKVGASAIISRIVDHLKDESEPFRKMVMESIDKILAALGAMDVDAKLESQLVDGALYAFQEQTTEDTRTMLNGFGVIINSLGQRAKLYLPQICGIIKWRLNNKLARVRQQAADLIGRIAIVLKTCNEEQLMQHLGVVLYEYLGEEYPDVLASILGALKAIVNVIGMSAMTPPIKDLLPRLTPILRNRHERVQETTIDLVGRIADRGAEFVSAKEWMRICFELLEMLKAHKKGIRRATVNCFPHDHEVLTKHGFMSRSAVAAHFQSHATLDVACFVDGQLQYHAISSADVTDASQADASDASVPFRLVTMSLPRLGISLTPTDNHRMWAATGQAGFEVMTADSFTKLKGDADIKLQASFPLGATATGAAAELPFVSALGLTTPDQLDAFLELYGLWLGGGSLSAQDKAVCFGPRKAEDAAYLDALLARLPIGESDVHRRAASAVPEDSEAASTNGRSAALEIVHPAWWAMFAELAELDAVSADDSRALWDWALNRLSRQQSRLVLRGLRCADGEESRGAVRGGVIYTSSVRSRDSIERLALHAGYSTLLAIAEAGVQSGETRWAVRYTENAEHAMPVLQSSKEVIGERKHAGPVWCVTVPTKQQLIMVRRVLSSTKDGVVLEASRPLIVGNTFGYIAKAIGPHDVLATLLNNLKVQERQNRVCTTVAIAIVAETCAPFTVLPALMNEYRVPELNVQNGVLKALSFLFEYIGEMAKDYVYALLPLLEDALMDRDMVHRQTAASVVKHMSLGVQGLSREDAMAHLLNFVWPNIFETSPHLINAVTDAIDGLRTALGPTKMLQYILQGLFHPARKVRTVYWRLYNSVYIGCQDALVPAYPRLVEDKDVKYRRWELEQFL